MRFDIAPTNENVLIVRVREKGRMMAVRRNNNRLGSSGVGRDEVEEGKFVGKEMVVVRVMVWLGRSRHARLLAPPDGTLSD